MEMYFSVDIEADGPIPGPNSMIALAAAAFDREGNMVGVFEANLKELPDAEQDPNTMKFWSRNKEAWEACRKNPGDPEEVMKRFHKWVTATAKKFNCKPVLVAFPAGFDFTFVYWYLIRFVKHSPFSFSALDMKTFAMFLINCEYRKVTKNRMPDRWMSATHKHTHKAIDDAIEQGHIFMNMIREYRSFINMLSNPETMP